MTFARLAISSLLALACATAYGAPVESPWPVDASGGAVATAAAALSGHYAVANTSDDSIEVRDIRGDLQRTITRAEIEALAPWFDLEGGPDGPCGLAFTDSGRSLFILAYDTTTPPDGLASDVVLRYDTFLDTLTLFTRVNLDDQDADWPRLAAAHYKGRLFVGTGAGQVIVFRAERNDATGVPLNARALPGSASVRGLAVARDLDTLFAASDTTIYRADINDPTLALTTVGVVPGINSIAYSSHYGSDGLSQDGLYVLSSLAPGLTGVQFVQTLQATGVGAFAPVLYHLVMADALDAAATADGALLIARGDEAIRLSDSNDTRLGFEDWLVDEFEQVVEFSRGLISPDGEPDGWVIDADVELGGSRFHPATPDGACWVVLALIMNDHLFGDPTAQERVRTILKRYAGQMPDGFKPGVSADGQIRHWCDPFSTTGAAKPGWNDEFASLSTMKIVLAAARARSYYASDAEIRAASDEIIGRVGPDGWDPYIQNGTDRLYLVSAGANPNFGIASNPFMEGIIFVEQAAAYGTAYSQNAYARWLTRTLWPTATFVTGMPITGGSPGNYQAAFLTGYPLLVQDEFRASPLWLENARNLLASNGAWTDDNGPQFMTVFSAGTTKGIWGGYNADDLGNHPGDLTTFPSLMAFSGTGDTAPAVGAYNAYRRGARQTFDSGASILYRRSNVDRAYSPNTAGLPDVVLGALGLAELIQPGSVDAALAVPYPSIDDCPGDLTTTGASAGDPGFGTPDGSTNLSDLLYFVNVWSADLGDPTPNPGSIADVTTTGTSAGDPGFAQPDGNVNLSDLLFFVNEWSVGLAACP